MAFTRRYAEIPIDCIDTSKIQARQENINSNVENLANSIELQGLFSPVLVVKTSDDKYELIAGQRRVKAFREFLVKTNSAKFSQIPAFVYDNILEWEKRAISINENFNQEPMTENDKIAAVTACYNEFGNMTTTAERTGISYANVRKYVRYERLPKVLKDLKNDGQITLKTAIEAADLYDLDTSNTGDTPDEEIEKCALELQQLTSAQKKRVKTIKKETDLRPVDAIVDVKENQEETQEITTEITSKTYGRVESYRQKRDIKSIPIAASELIEEGLDANDV